MTALAIVEAVMHRVHEDVVRHFEARFEWRHSTEQQLWEELVGCVLGSQVDYEMSVAALGRLKAHGLLDINRRLFAADDFCCRVEAVLTQPITGVGGASGPRRYRFPRTKASYTHRTAVALFVEGRGLKDLLIECNSALDARRRVCGVAVGVGPKQASLFLRNIGFASDLAVLDGHVLRFMKACGCVPADQRAPRSLKEYERYERFFVEYANSLGYDASSIDLTIWVVMRVAQRWGY